MSEPNPIDGIWYSTNEQLLPCSSCWGCRRGLRRAYQILDGGEITHFHLVRPGITLDCTGLNYRMEEILKDVPEFTLADFLKERITLRAEFHKRYGLRSDEQIDEAIRTFRLPCGHSLVERWINNEAFKEYVL